MTALAGFKRLPTADGELWVDEQFESIAQELGLSQRSVWISRIAAGLRAGRGRIAFVESSGRRFVLKQLRRGGLAGPLWRDRFLSRRRLNGNLSLPQLARERGVSTPAALALLVVSGPPGLWRGWLAVDAVAGALDLQERVKLEPPASVVWAAALSAVRPLHDAGIDHPDLNLGNLLIDDAGCAWVVDLDRCIDRGGPLTADRRIDGIRRIERSYLKTCFLHGIDADSALDWLSLYGGGELEIRWSERGARDSAKLKRHRRGWRR